MRNWQNYNPRTILMVMMALMVVLAISLPACASPDDVVDEKVGVLVIAHGSTAKWCDSIKKAVKSANLDYPVEIGFLEQVENETIPDAVEKLDGKGVTKIVAVPLFISSNSGHIDEIKYILGLIDEAPEDGLVRVDSSAKIILTNAMDDHPFISGIAAERASKLTKGPENETVVLVFHGSSDDDIAKWNKSSASFASDVKLLMRYELGINIYDVKYGFANVNDSEEYSSYGIGNVVSRVAETSHPIVIPIFMADGYYTDKKLPSMLSNTSYSYPVEGSRGLIPHKNVGEWIEVMVERGLLETPYAKISMVEDGKTIKVPLRGFCPCKVSAYRASMAAFAHEEVWGGLPVRGDVSIVCAHPSDGHEMIFLSILGERTDDFIADVPDSPLSADNYAYKFVQKSTGNSVDVKVRKDVFPPKMFELRELAHDRNLENMEIRQAFMLMRWMAREKILFGPMNEVFDVSVKMADGMPVLPGWNFISVPSELQSSSIDAVFGDLKYDAILYYNAMNGCWEQGGVGFTDIEPLKAYWIKNPRNYIQPVPKAKLSQKVPAVPASINLHNGWNAIGYCDATDSLTAEMTLASIDDSYTWIKGPYNSMDNSYGSVGHNGVTGVISGKHVGTDLFMMSPYNGYWVFMTKEKTLHGF